LVETYAPIVGDLLVGAEVSTKNDSKKIRKAATPELVIEAGKILAKYDVNQRAVFSFIIGFPWQGYNDCINAVDFIKNIILTYGIRVYLQWYWPMPGSPIWDQLEFEGKVSLTMADIPGFYLERDWFFRSRAMSESEVMKLDEQIKLVQTIVNIHQYGKRRTALNYSSPEFRSRSWTSRKNPFIDESIKSLGENFRNA
jgi:radical SAM superfamily enzyme YgiQ (UPF0313 family)